ncbi:DUF6694 family lipoprotein [Siccibacter turicensis]
MKKMIISALAVLLLAGCNDPKIDATTEDTLKSSLQEVRNSLDEADKPRFDKAVEVVALSNISIPELLQAKEKENDAFIQNKFKETLNGKSGKEVISLADDITRKQADEKRQAVAREIATLEANKAHRDLATEKLQAFELKSSRIEYGKEVNGDAPVTLIMTITNPEKIPVYGVSWVIERFIDGKPYPDTARTFSYVFPQPLAAGERGEITLSLGNKTAWANDGHLTPEAFSVWLYRVDGADKKPIYNMVAFNDNDEARLQQLKQQAGK